MVHGGVGWGFVTPLIVVEGLLCSMCVNGSSSAVLAAPATCRVIILNYHVALGRRSNSHLHALHDLRKTFNVLHVGCRRHVSGVN